MATRRGSTPIIALTVLGEDFSASTVYVTIDQNGEQLTKNSNSDSGDMWLSPIYDETTGERIGTKINLYLSQDETLKFDVGKADVQIRWVESEGTAHVSDVQQIEFTRVLLEDVITYVS